MGPGSVVEGISKNGMKQQKIGKPSKPSGGLRRGERRPSSFIFIPPQTLSLASLADFLRFSPGFRAWSQAIMYYT